MKEEWSTYRLGEIAECSLGKMLDQHKNKGVPHVYLGNVAVRWGSFNVDFNQTMLFEDEELERFQARKGDIIICEGGEPGRCAVWKEEYPICIQKALHRVRVDNNFCSSFVYYAFVQAVKSGKAEPFITGSTIKHLPRQGLVQMPIFAPSLSMQQRIASILSSLDDKIELNNRINANLEAQAQALFKSWFIDFEPFQDGEFVDSELGRIPKGWKVSSLTKIANYLNGLAMQKYPAKCEEESLPVLKIKELGAKRCDETSDRCTIHLKPEYIINDGDVIFSWSGTLLVDLWCGDKCGLNQHLFKVTSSTYPKWYYLYWTKYHLENFIHIAKDKAVTMGHIKRSDLDNSAVLIPTDSILSKMNQVMTPIIDKIVSTNIETRKLAELRDTLLPRLMSDEIEV